MLGNVLAFGGREIYLLLNVLMKTSGRPEKHFLGMAALVLFREVLVLSPQYRLLRPAILPALLYGAENWILTPVLVDRLESFQGELAKRILCWPKHHSNTAATLAVGLHSVKSKVLEAKLSFCRKS